MRPPDSAGQRKFAWRQSGAPAVPQQIKKSVSEAQTPLGLCIEQKAIPSFVQEAWRKALPAWDSGFAFLFLGEPEIRIRARSIT
jgi:hypothetical protein